MLSAAVEMLIDMRSAHLILIFSHASFDIKYFIFNNHVFKGGL